MATMTREQRRLLLEMAQRRQRPGTGSHREFLLKRTASVEWPDLTNVLSPIPWAVVGAVATRHYMPERVTHDLDIAIAVADSAETRRRLTGAGFDCRGELSVGRSSWKSPEGTSLEVVEGAEQWLLEGIVEAQANRDEQGLPILPLPHLALMKFRAGRVQDFADLSRMLGQANDQTLDDVRRLLSVHAPDGSEDLLSLIALGKLELEP